MLLDPRFPLAVGTIAIAMVTSWLADESPSPGSLSSAHQGIVRGTDVQSCAVCHTEQGLSAGCLSCHDEIEAQLQEDRGYHAYLAKGATSAECGACHPEHHGPSFGLVSDELSWGSQVKGAFLHPHVEFGLDGKHDALDCRGCHEDMRQESFTLEAFPDVPRRETFLGLTQSCARCHEDVHAGGLVSDCGACHGQDQFAPAEHFDHGAHFELGGGHAGLDCKACHVFPEPPSANKSTVGYVAWDQAAGEPEARALPFPFDHLRGEGCSGCHQQPHFTVFAGQCDQCHPGSDPDWGTALNRVTPALHAQAGFRLEGPHGEVSCDRCHAREVGFDQRYQNPAAPGYLRGEDSCQGCHADEHRGQFADRYSSCLDCHERHRFQPSGFDHQSHAKRYALDGAHAAVACSQCHVAEASLQGARRFVGTRQDCSWCHTTPHGNQFAKEITEGDCTSCHSARIDTFAIEAFDHRAETGYALEGAHHHLAACDECHTEVAAPAELVAAGAPARMRVYQNTPRECSACHDDAHRGQFQAYGEARSCRSCHSSFWTWDDVDFDHRTSRFPLEGAHAQVACDRCHVPAETDGVTTVQYRPVGTLCGACHEIPEAVNHER